MDATTLRSRCYDATRRDSSIVHASAVNLEEPAASQQLHSRKPRAANVGTFRGHQWQRRSGRITTERPVVGSSQLLAVRLLARCRLFSRSKAVTCTEPA